MSEQIDNTDDGEDEGAAVSGRKRERSQIEFPYTDLERAVELARKLYQTGGPSKIDQTQLAVAMDQTASGGTFRGRLGAAKMFGLIDTELGSVQLQPLGLRIINDEHPAAAKVEAFLNIELYRAMFEALNGHPLPSAQALELQIEKLGVPSKQKERARQAFSSSALYAGFIASNGRFSKPAVTAGVTQAATPADEAKKPPADDEADKGRRTELHPFIVGLLETLPPPGTQWTMAERADWLQTASSIFKLIYKGSGKIDVSHVSENETGGQQ